MGIIINIKFLKMKFVLLAFLFLVFKINDNSALDIYQTPRCNYYAKKGYPLVEPCTGENEFGKIRFAHGDRECKCDEKPIPDCQSLDCYSSTGCNNKNFGQIGSCFDGHGNVIDCKCPIKSVKDCWNMNKCLLDEHCGKNGKCRFYHPQQKEGLCSCQSEALADTFVDDVCKMQPVKPHETTCFAAIPKWFYDFRHGKCFDISYGGCHGTENLFDTRAQCEAKCPIVVEEDVCKMPPVTPNQKKCKAYIEKWTYVSRQGECVPFIYGGCHGTENLFDTQAQCEARCPTVAKTPLTNF